MVTRAKQPKSQEEGLSPLALNLRRLRTERGWSQGELAEKIGVHLTHVSRVETGKYTPGLDFVINAARAFGLTVDELVSEHPEGFEEVRLEDKEFGERLRLLETLDDRDRKALLTVMDAFLTKKHLQKLAEH